MRRRIRLAGVVCLAALAAPACDVFQVVDPAALAFDGAWRLTFSSLNATSCVVIRNGRIWQFDSTCAGANQVVQNSKSAVVQGARVVWTADLGFQAFQLTIDVQSQSDGSLVGTLTLIPVAASGQETAVEPIVMVRR